MELKVNQVKEQASLAGSDLCGIASIDRFNTMPALSNPAQILEGAKSVIVVAKRFLNSTLNSSSTIPYTIIRNYLSSFMDDITIKLAYYLEEKGFTALPSGAIGPCNYNKELSKAVGLISLKNAAYQAGLGVIGKNTLLITPEFGNMVWLGAVITTAELTPDKMISKNPCPEKCRICIDNCPVNAIDGSHLMDQGKCWNHAFGEVEDGGEWRIKCFKCREICPYAKGFKI